MPVNKLPNFNMPHYAFRSDQPQPSASSGCFQASGWSFAVLSHEISQLTEVQRVQAVGCLKFLNQLQPFRDSPLAFGDWDSFQPNLARSLPVPCGKSLQAAQMLLRLPPAALATSATRT